MALLYLLGKVSTTPFLWLCGAAEARQIQTPHAPCQLPEGSAGTKPQSQLITQ